jgi:hypothetical protein
VTEFIAKGDKKMARLFKKIDKLMKAGSLERVIRKSF